MSEEPLSSSMKFDFMKYCYPFHNTAKRVVIIGASGSGKTFFGAHLMKYIMHRGKIPVIIVDTKREEKFSEIPLVSPDWVNEHLSSIRKLVEIKMNGELIRDYRVSEFACACAWVMKDSAVYIEEVVEHVPKNSISFPQTNPLLYKALQQGRERGVSVIVATQRVAQLNLSFVDEATDIFIFRVNSRESKFIEDSFRLPKNSIDFENKPEYSFYHVEAGKNPVLYKPIRVIGLKKNKESV